MALMAYGTKIYSAVAKLMTYFHASLIVLRIVSRGIKFHVFRNLARREEIALGI
jgi:hypothetical protein